MKMWSISKAAAMELQKALDDSMLRLNCWKKDMTNLMASQAGRIKDFTWCIAADQSVGLNIVPRKVVVFMEESEECQAKVWRTKKGTAFDWKEIHR